MRGPWAAVSSEPDGACVLEDGHVVCRSSPCAFWSAQATRHRFLLLRDGYLSGEVVIHAPEHMAHVKLEKQPPGKVEEMPAIVEARAACRRALHLPVEPSPEPGLESMAGRTLDGYDSADGGRAVPDR